MIGWLYTCDTVEIGVEGMLRTLVLCEDKVFGADFVGLLGIRSLSVRVRIWVDWQCFFGKVRIQRLTPPTLTDSARYFLMPSSQGIGQPSLPGIM